MTKSLEQFAVQMRVAALEAESSQLFDASLTGEERTGRMEELLRRLWTYSMLANEIDAELDARCVATDARVEALAEQVAELEIQITAARLRGSATP